jgi:branched-chain amino acid transport system permease protein
MIALGVLVVAPQFVNLYVSNVLNWIALYVVMGMGLNVMIGFTGLLDLGYVASFAIGAYTLGILTAPNILTCGGVDPSDIPFSEISSVCTGTLTFWQAWPICVIVSASTGMLLGVPVLGLRGDYLAIVTLGFGEITNRVIKSNATSDLLGGAQGISPIPVPEIDLTAISDNWQYVFSGSSSVFYLYLFSVVITAFIVWRLSRSRLGRAWRAIRADEDVAEAMGIDLVKYKLLAFGVSSAFAGLGGAVFGVQLQGIFPDSFTILVSINVLSLIILGGMGSLAGVVLGAIVLVGLPELLRELGAYRLMGYGALLVIVMLTKPEGLLPPSPPKLTEKAERSRSEATPEQTGVFAREPRTEGAD